MKKLFFFLSVLLILSSCSKETDSILVINTKPKVFYAGDSLQLDVSSHKEVAYLVENEYYASVSSKGLIKAKKVGTTTVKISTEEETKTFPITVKAREYLYADPQLDWNMNSDQVISALGVTKDDVKFGEDYFYIENYSLSAYSAIFLFDDKTKKLASYMICVDRYKVKQAAAFLKERYYYVDYNSDGAYFIGDLPKDLATGTKCIFVSSELKTLKNKYIFQIFYYKFDNTTKAFIPKKNIEEQSYKQIYDQIINKF